MFGKDTIESLEKGMIEKGKLHNAELANHIKLTSYLNQIASDYKFVYGRNGVPYVEYIDKKSGATMKLPMQQFQDQLMGTYSAAEEAARKAAEAAAEKKRIDSGATGHDLSDGTAKKVEQKGGYIAPKYKRKNW